MLSIDVATGNLRDLSSRLPFHCPDCNALAQEPVDAPEAPEVPEKREIEVGSLIDASEDGFYNTTPLYKRICAPIYKLRATHVSQRAHYNVY